MWHDYLAFTSYHPTSSQHVLLADNTKAPVTGVGSIKILLDGRVCGFRNVLHIPSLRVPLYSLRAHRRMEGCGFLGDNGCFQVYFPGFVTTVEDSVDSYINYSPLGRASPLTYDFRQNRARSSSRATSKPQSTSPTIIPFSPSEMDDGDDADTASTTSDTYDIEFPPLPLALPSLPRALPSSTAPVALLAPPPAPPLLRHRWRGC